MDGYIILGVMLGNTTGGPRDRNERTLVDTRRQLLSLAYVIGNGDTFTVCFTGEAVS